MSIPNLSRAIRAGHEVDEDGDGDNSPYTMACDALTKPDSQHNLDAFNLLKRVHNEEFGFHETWTEAISALKDNPIPASMDPKWPAFLVFPCPRGPDGKGFDIDLARRILRDEQMGFRLGYAVQILAFVFVERVEEDPRQVDQFKKEEHVKEIWKCLTLFDYLLFPSGDRESKEPFSERLCNWLLFRIWQREKEGDVKAFWEELKREGKLPPPDADEKVEGSPFYKGVARAGLEIRDYGKDEDEVKVKFDTEAWRKPKPVLSKEFNLEELERRVREFGIGLDGERISSGSGKDGH